MLLPRNYFFHVYTSRFLPAKYIGLILLGTTEATASWSTVEGALRVRRSTVHALAAAYPQSTLNGTPTCSILNGTVSYETYVAGQEESGCVYR